jgi:hypothetical protein
MYWKWYQNDWLPPLRIDQHPWLVRGGALGVLLLELAFPLLILSRRGRLVAAAGGLAFHLFAQQFMRLGFASLWWCYVVLVDFRPVVAWLHDEPRPEPPEDEPPGRSTPLLLRPVVLAGAFLLAANVVQGFRGAVQAWPFSCYPTFQYRVDKDMPDLVVTAVSDSGAEKIVLDGTHGLTFRPQREWGIVWKLLGVYGPAPNGAGLRAYYSHAAGRIPPPDGTRTLRFYRASYDTTPERRGMPPTERALVLELPP